MMHTQHTMEKWTVDTVQRELLTRLANGPVHVETLQEQLLGMGIPVDVVNSSLAQSVDTGLARFETHQETMFLRLT